MRLNLTTTHDILVSFVQAPSECPKDKKARADRDFHSPLIPPLNVSPELDPQQEAQLDLTTACGCLAAGGLCPAAEAAGAQVAGAGAHSLTHPSGVSLACCSVLTIRCALLQEDLAVADTSIEKPRSQEEGPCKSIAG